MDESLPISMIRPNLAKGTLERGFAQLPGWHRHVRLAPKPDPQPMVLCARDDIAQTTRGESIVDPPGEHAAGKKRPISRWGRYFQRLFQKSFDTAIRFEKLFQKCNLRFSLAFQAIESAQRIRPGELAVVERGAIERYADLKRLAQIVQIHRPPRIDFAPAPQHQIRIKGFGANEPHRARCETGFLRMPQRVRVMNYGVRLRPRPDHIEPDAQQRHRSPAIVPCNHRIGQRGRQNVVGLSAQQRFKRFSEFSRVRSEQFQTRNAAWLHLHRVL